ncbi:MAG: DUF4326 domain-containing protein [Candidatus Blackburnbacteria bacterium]|nr:DUF4326 domain-containing protein [Candidatus Blackburnbacteria bacterium]
MLKKQIVNIGRPGPWGNQFKIGRDGTREECVAKHWVWFLAPEQAPLRARARKELRGKTIANGLLWCPGCRGTKPCHWEIVEEVANAN